jgi:pyruvate dehydrogenase E1 component alpha subunit
MRCPVHLSIGQEAVPVGVCAALNLKDEIVSTHRCHAHYLAKGGDLKAMLAEIYGRATGCCGGRGGSMHLMDPSVGMALSLPVVSSAIPVAVGFALGYRQRAEDRVAAAFLGDGSVEEGVFHEAMNFAALKKLPVIFVLENNLYAVYTKLADRQPDRPLEALAHAHGMDARRVDGNDVEGVARAAADAVQRARRGDGPSLLIFDTYRWREHCGPGYDNDIGYRTEAEFLAWQARCPIDRLRRSLTSTGLLDSAQEAAIARIIGTEIEEAFQAARDAPFPPGSSAAQHVYD